jgi:hypothetical protein
MTGIKSHFVPQVYLRNFGEKIFLFDKLREKIHEATPKTVAHESNFYGPKINEVHPLETAFSQIEGKTNFALKELIQNQIVSKTTDTYFTDLCDFVALQYLRTDEKRKQIQEVGDFALRELFSNDHPEIDRKSIETIH